MLVGKSGTGKFFWSWRLARTRRPAFCRDERSEERPCLRGYELDGSGRPCRVGEAEDAVAFESARKPQHRISADVIADFALYQLAKPDLRGFDGRQHPLRIRTNHDERCHELERAARKLTEVFRGFINA